MARPKVNIALTNGGLNIQPPTEFGSSGVLIASPVAPVAGYGVAFVIKSIAQAQTAFAQAGNEAVVEAIEKGFYAEAPEGTTLRVLCMAQATTLVTLASAVNAEKLLTPAAGELRLLTAIKFPSGGYTPTITNGFDQDVHDAVAAFQTLANTWFGKKKPFRFIAQGYGATTISAAKDYATGTYPNGFIVDFTINDSSAWAAMLFAGRVARINPEENAGKIKTGSLNIPDSAAVKIGSTAVESVSDADLDTLYDKRYISVEKNQVASGYVFNDDSAIVAPTNDYNNMRFGRVIDNAVRVAFDVYYRELKSEVDVTEGGRLGAVAEKALEAAIENAINQRIRGQFSLLKDGTADVNCLVNPDAVQYAALYADNGISSPNFNLLNAGQVYLFLKCRPKGCIKTLNVYLGYVA